MPRVVCSVDMYSGAFSWLRRNSSSSHSNLPRRMRVTHRSCGGRSDVVTIVTVPKDLILDSTLSGSRVHTVNPLSPRDSVTQSDTSPYPAFLTLSQTLLPHLVPDANAETSSSLLRKNAVWSLLMPSLSTSTILTVPSSRGTVRSLNLNREPSMTMDGHPSQDAPPVCARKGSSVMTVNVTPRSTRYAISALVRFLPRTKWIGLGPMALISAYTSEMARNPSSELAPNL